MEVRKLALLSPLLLRAPRLRRLPHHFATGAPFGVGGLPVSKRLHVASLALGADAGEEGFGGLELVGVDGAPVGGEAALEGRLQEALTVGLQQRAAQREAIDRLV